MTSYEVSKRHPKNFKNLFLKRWSKTQGKTRRNKEKGKRG